MVSILVGLGVFVAGAAVGAYVGIKLAICVILDRIEAAGYTREDIAAFLAKLDADSSQAAL